MNHPTLKATRALRMALPALLLLGLGACGGGHDGPEAPKVSADVTVSVPTEVATNATAATSYVASLSSTPAANSESLEPVVVPDQVASDDTAEPV